MDDVSTQKADQELEAIQDDEAMAGPMETPPFSDGEQSNPPVDSKAVIDAVTENIMQRLSE